MKVQTKIILLLFSISFLFLSGFLALRYLERNREQLLVRNRIHEKNTLFDKIVKLKGASLEIFTFDVTRSDDLLRFIRTGNREWARHYIDAIMPGFNVQAVWIFRSDFSLAYETSLLQTPAIKLFNAHMDDIKALLTIRPFCQFFLNTPQEFIEIRTAPIQPSSDIERKTPPQGYLFAGRLWSEEYIEELSDLTENTIKLLPIRAGEKTFEDAYSYDFKRESFSFTRIVNGIDKNPVIRLNITSTSPTEREFNRSTTRQLILFVLFASVIVLIITVALVVWVNYPLKLISQSLSIGNPAIIKTLQQNRTEFGSLAQLIASFFQQKDELIKEVRDRTRAEEALTEANQALSALIEASPLAIISIGADKKIKMWNPAAERMFGWKRADVLGSPLPFVPPDKKVEVDAIGQLVLGGKSFTDLDMRCQKKDGSPIDIVISSAPLRDASGAVSDIMAVIIDTTLNRQLIQEILEISAREQRRIGQDLHDGLSQHLTGIAFLSKVLEQKLSIISSCDASQAKELTQLVHQAIDMTRSLASGLLPVELGEDGLMLALEEFSATVSNVFNIACVFTCNTPVFITDTNASTHLFRIAQEAVNNAIKHGSARHIKITLARQNENNILTIEDDGVGFPDELETKKGMGLRIMNYRSRMIGASLSVGNNPSGGGIVTCVFHRL